jgi:hypothetical protein
VESVRATFFGSRFSKISQLLQWSDCRNTRSSCAKQRLQPRAVDWKLRPEIRELLDHVAQAFAWCGK